MNADTESWDNEGGHIGIAEGGHMSSSSGRVVRVPGAELPYTVILTRLHLVDLSRSFRTMREAEAFVRRNTPVPAPVLSTLYDRAAGET
jgi:hypothetical protein